MKTLKLPIGILVSMILFSLFFTNVVNLLRIDALAPEKFTKDNYMKITDTADNLIWFLQISDLHISVFRDPLRITEFKEFCHYTVDAIKPSVVLASGDLTDARTKDSFGTEQLRDEWKYYRDVLIESHMKERTIWLDIRGNHDNFNVAHENSNQNFFTNYSIQGREHPRSYMYQIRNGNAVYSFIAVDACLEPGPRTPFNFVGMLNNLEVDKINSLIRQSEASPSNYTVWFGHFPTSCIVTSGPESVRDLIGKLKNGLVYVCGHLHTVYGLVPRMYTLQKAGFLELELADWKDNRKYRLLAIDHGLLSFVDIQHREWPVILVTNPKHALFVNPAKENLDNIRNSTHIRVLAFSLAKIDFVKVKIDDDDWIDCKNVEGPLYVARWNPQQYLEGVHKIEVYVKDIDGRTKSENQPFSLDGTQLSFSVLAKFALMTNASMMFRVMFFSMLLITILPLCIVRYTHTLVATVRIVKPRIGRNFCSAWLQKIWILTTVDRIFWPIILYPLYLALGPWTIGYIVEDHIGAVFAWGIFVNGSYLPGSITYEYGFIQLFAFQLPLTLIMANVMDYRFQEVILKTGKNVPPIRSKFFLHLPFFIVFSLQVSRVYRFWLAYGTLAFILGPLWTWSLVLAGILYYQVLTLPEKCTRKAAKIWHVLLDTSSNQNDHSLSQIEKIN